MSTTLELLKKIPKVQHMTVVCMNAVLLNNRTMSYKEIIRTYARMHDLTDEEWIDHWSKLQTLSRNVRVVWAYAEKKVQEYPRDMLYLPLLPPDNKVRRRLEQEMRREYRQTPTVEPHNVYSPYADR